MMGNIFHFIFTSHAICLRLRETLNATFAREATQRAGRAALVACVRAAPLRLPVAL
jgi:hypothetical protein